MGGVSLATSIYDKIHIFAISLEPTIVKMQEARHTVCAQGVLGGNGSIGFIMCIENIKVRVILNELTNE